MINFKKSLAVALILAVLLTSMLSFNQMATVSANDTDIYTDVSSDHWAYNTINELSAMDLVRGSGDGTFNPQGNITRAEFATMLVNIVLSYMPDLEIEYQGTFKDCQEGQWFTPYVELAEMMGIVNGTGNGNFSPNQNITREQMAVMTVNFCYVEDLEQTVAGITLEFTDADKISGYAVNSVKFAQAANIINGYPNGTFNPQGTATRAESAQIIWNFLYSEFVY